MKKRYTGVGSRAISLKTQEKFVNYINQLNSLDYICRTGDAKGSDATFRLHAKEVIAYCPEDIDPNDWTAKELDLCMPNDRPTWRTFRKKIQNLLRRNMMQVLGPIGIDPSEFLLCWAPSTHYLDSSSGGTGYAIRCALNHGIPVYNLFSTHDERRLRTRFDFS
jgi:hypothetical protein